MGTNKPEAHLVNKYFRDGVPYLMYGFNPWTMDVTLKALKDSAFWSLLVSPTMEEVISAYSKNWGDVIDRFLTWQEDKYPDPVDQCHALSQQSGEMLIELFKGINVSELTKDDTFVSLYYSTGRYLESLSAEIMGWALTHKFQAEIFEDVFEEE